MNKRVKPLRRFTVVIMALCLVCTSVWGLPSRLAETAEAATKEPTKTVELSEKTLQAMDIVTEDNLTEDGLNTKVKRQEFAKMLVQLSAYKDKAGTVKYALYSDVKKTNSYAKYIKIASEQGWMKANLSGKFRPTAYITLQEAVNAVVKILGYENSDFKGSLSSAKMSFYEAEGLDANITKSKSEKLTYKDVICLFYNMLVNETKAGSVYAETLGYKTDGNGDIDYLTLIYNDIEGPVLAKGEWESEIPFLVNEATVYVNGELKTKDFIEEYDVVYYNERVKSLFVYNERVTGELQAVLPNRYSPQTVTVTGTSYNLSGQSVAYQASAMGDFAIGDYVTLLMGKDDNVEYVVKATEANAMPAGVVIAKGEKLFDDEDANVSHYLTVLNSYGKVKDYAVKTYTTYSIGDAVSITYSDNEPTVSRLNQTLISGYVDSDAEKLGNYSFAENIRISEYDSYKNYCTVPRYRLADTMISSPKIKYYHLNSQNEITDLVLYEATGDIHKYGVLVSATEDYTTGQTISATGERTTYIANMTGVYELMTENGAETYRTTDYIYDYNGKTGPIEICYDDDMEITSLKLLNGYTVSNITDLEFECSSLSLKISDKLQVYLKKSSKYYATSLSKVDDLTKYKLTAYKDNASGTEARVVVAEAK